MFLDEELEQIYEENCLSGELTAKLFQALKSRMPNADDGVQAALTQLKRIDNAWRLFCKRHTGFNPNGWRETILKADHTGKFKKALNW